MLALMRRRKLHFALAGCLLVLLAVWMLLPPAKEKDDEQRFRQMVRTTEWGWRFHSAQRRLPTALARLLHLPDLRTSFMRKAETEEQALLTSGYLTNASVTISNLPTGAADEKSCLLEVQRRLRGGVHVDYLTFYMESNQAIVTCRSRDLAGLRAAIQKP